MKQVKLLFSVAALSIGALSITSCGSDTEVCPVGYEGTDCKTLSRDKFIGDWEGTEDCTVATSLDKYTVTISKSSTSDIQLVLKNIYNEDFTANGTMTSENKFTFNGTEDGTTFSGTGTLSGTSLSVDYNISNATLGLSNSCVFTGTLR